MNIYKNKLLAIFIALVIIFAGVGFSYWTYINFSINEVSCTAEGCSSSVGAILAAILFSTLVLLGYLWEKYKGK